MSNAVESGRDEDHLYSGVFKHPLNCSLSQKKTNHIIDGEAFYTLGDLAEQPPSTSLMPRERCQ